MMHLIVGNTGSGKTTYAHQLQVSTNGIVFSIDHWNKTLFMPDKRESDGLEWFLERIDRAEAMIVDLVHQLERCGVDAILDLGLSKYTHREKFRQFAAEHGYEVKLHFLDIGTEIRLERVMRRNEEQGDTYQFEVSRENFDFMESWFEAPSKDEMESGITIEI